MKAVTNKGGGPPEKPKAKDHKSDDPQQKKQKYRYKLLLTNLNTTITETHLYDIFEGATAAYIDREEAQSKGTGRVTFSTRVEAEYYFRTHNGMDLEGRKLKIELLIENTKDKHDSVVIG